MKLPTTAEGERLIQRTNMAARIDWARNDLMQAASLADQLERTEDHRRLMLAVSVIDDIRSSMSESEG